jgi:hypothetical protein
MMQFATTAFNQDLLELLNSAFDAAFGELGRTVTDAQSWEVAETMMTLRLMTSVASGERDVRRLKDLALQAIDGRQIDGQAL